jgi:hypothetical protein
LDSGATGEALKYAPQIADPSRRAEVWLRLGCPRPFSHSRANRKLKEAAEAAVAGKDGEVLSLVRMRARDPAVVAFIDAAAAAAGLTEG